MDSPYRIFKKLPEGPIWIESAISLHQCKERLARLDKASPGEYFVYDLRRARIVADMASALFVR